MNAPQPLAELHLEDAEATRQLGARLGRTAPPGGVLALGGDLGAGKTCLAQGLAVGLDVREPRQVTSPTFALWHTHPGRCVLHHLDLYRLSGVEEADSIGLEEAFADDAVTLVEWYTHAPELLPSDHLVVHLSPDAGGGRRATVFATGPRGRAWWASAEGPER
jgi:tRNA threonylcarbamoyl adenosine modification protein YjeE